MKTEILQTNQGAQDKHTLCIVKISHYKYFFGQFIISNESNLFIVFKQICHL